jgi:type I restriction enzyme S subunit
VAQYMTTTSFKQEMDARATGTTVFGLRQPELLECKLMLPPLPTQRKIAAVLSSLDDKIENNRKICANLEAQAQAIFKSWFVDFEPFGGKMPQGWKMGKLGDVAEITMGQSPDGKSLNDVDDGITFFQGRAEFGNRYPTKRLSTTEPKRMAKEGDVLLSVRAPVGDLNIALENCCIGRGLAAIRAKTECADQDVARPPRPCGKGDGALATSRRCQSFIYCLLRSMKPQFDLYEGAGTIFGSINKDSLHGLSCLVPDEKALQEFEGVVSSFDSLYRERELESRALAALRDALLSKLMSGEIDVEKVEVA